MNITKIVELFVSDDIDNKLIAVELIKNLSHDDLIRFFELLLIKSKNVDTDDEAEICINSDIVFSILKLKKESSNNIYYALKLIIVSCNTHHQPIVAMGHGSIVTYLFYRHWNITYTTKAFLTDLEIAVESWKKYLWNEK